MMMVLFFLSILAIAPFLFIMYYVLEQGLSAVNWEFLLNCLSPPQNKEEAVSNALLGSLIVVGMASVLVSLGGLA